MVKSGFGWRVGGDRRIWSASVSIGPRQSGFGRRVSKQQGSTPSHEPTSVRPMSSKPAIGGGAKKVLYTLATLQRMGVAKAAKALTSHNACKACGLGMGGQRGGMTDELGEFPAICNKSVQAQSSDVRPPIAAEIFEHSLDDLRELSGRELDHLGRLGQPIHKPIGSNRYTPIGWDAAMNIAGGRFAASQPDRTFFYSSGRSSNEAGFLLQLLTLLVP